MVSAYQPIVAQVKKGAEFEAKVFDFGVVDEGEVVKHRFSFTNTGKNPLEIRRVNSMCGCTVPKYTLEPVKANQTGFVDVEFNSAGFPGAAEKIVTVLFSDDKMVTLTLKGIVKQEDIKGTKVGHITIATLELDAGSLQPGQFFRSQVKFQVNDGGALAMNDSQQASDINVFLPGYSITEGEIASIMVLFRPDAKRAFGPIKEPIVLKTSNPNQPEITIVLTGSYVPKEAGK